jgi:hypothetical protein
MASILTLWAGRVVVRVRAHLETGVVEQRLVIFPARIADPHGGGRIDPPQQVRAELEPAGATERLDGDCAAGAQDFAVSAENELLHRPIVGLRAVDREIVARQRRLREALFDAAHAFENGHLPVVVVIDAYAQIHLFRVQVRIEGLRDAENGVARRQLEGGKQ